MLLVAPRQAIGCLAVATTDSATYNPARYSTRSSVSILGLVSTTRLAIPVVARLHLSPSRDRFHALFGELLVCDTCLFLHLGWK